MNRKKALELINEILNDDESYYQSLIIDLYEDLYVFYYNNADSDNKKGDRARLAYETF